MATYTSTLTSKQKPIQENKLQWGELADEDGADLNFLLPPREVIGPDENGIKKVIEYKFDDEGRKVKVTTTIRVCKVSMPSKRALERKSWAKFGDAVHEDDNSRLTMVSTEEIFLERRGLLGNKIDEPKAAADPLGQLGKGGGLLMICRTCGKKGDHWTSKCPIKDLAPQADISTNTPPLSSGTVSNSAAKVSNNYVPPSMRAGAERSSTTSVSRRNDENAIRIGNLSEDTLEPDLLELCRPFGPVLRAYIVKNFETGLSKGYGFVNFVHKDDAQKAIDKLNGYGYDNLILEVVWSVPRSK